MPDVFTKAKRSEVMSLIRSRGNRATELRLIELMREHGVTGWRRSARVFGKPDFCLSCGEGGGVCGWLFLARLSPARDAAAQQPEQLFEEPATTDEPDDILF